MDVCGLNLRCLQGSRNAVHGLLGRRCIFKASDYPLKVLTLNDGHAGQSQDFQNFGLQCRIVFDTELGMATLQIGVSLCYYELLG